MSGHFFQSGSGRITKPVPRPSAPSSLFTTEKISHLQRQIKELADRLAKNDLSTNEHAKLTKCLLVPSMWEQYRKSLPELDVRE